MPLKKACKHEIKLKNMCGYNATQGNDDNFLKYPIYICEFFFLFYNALLSNGNKRINFQSQLHLIENKKENGVPTQTAIVKNYCV